MRRKAVSGTVLMLLLTSMLALAFNIKPLKANGLELFIYGLMEA